MPGVTPAETEPYIFKGELNASEGTDTVRATELGDRMSATMQAKSANEALSPKGKRYTVVLQPLTQRHRNTSKRYVSVVNAVDVHKTVSYSDCYGRAPRSFVVDAIASGIPFLKSVANDCDPFTGK